MSSIWIIIWFAIKPVDVEAIKASNYEMFFNKDEVVNFIEQNKASKEMHVFKVDKKVGYTVLRSGKVILDEKKK